MAAAGPMCTIISSGMTTGFSAVLLPQLELASSHIRITKEEASWIASMAALPMALGCVLGGILMERFGRKTSHQIIAVPYVLGWVCISLSRAVWMLYVGRFLTGLCLGLMGPLTPVYIAETAGPNFRGILLAGVSLAVSSGILISHLLGTFLHWQLAAALSALFPFACYIGISFVPESPPWLAARGRFTEAVKAFRWFRGYSPESTRELRELLEKYQVNGHDASAQSTITMKEAFLHVTFVKPFLVMNLFFLVMQFSGVNAVAFYTVHILRDMGQGMNEYLATNIIGVVRLIMSVVACVLTRRFGRRPLTMLSCIGTGVSLVLLGLTIRSKIDACLPLLLLVTYICFISIGLVPLPWVMVGEVFPVRMRGIGSGVSSAFCFLVFFAVVKTSPATMEAIGADGTFFFYGAVALVGAGLLFLCLPETRNRTLQEIENSYQRKPAPV
ncbi:Facilitated trehalose transporter Tret1-2 [Blattella germanica]|nr:Facilitated trehalose transporter Tret1-2 [Blattella germanica]